MALSEMERADARLAIAEAVAERIDDRNVTLIGLGYKEVKKRPTQELAIRFHVRRKYGRGAQLEAAVDTGVTKGNFPTHIGKFATDVVQAVYRPQQWYRWGGWGWAQNERASRSNPLRAGISISNEQQYTYGTLGAAVKDRATGELMCLSNWHVLAGYWGAPRGQLIYQPGRLDGGTASDVVATLERDAMYADLDAAVASLVGTRTLINNQLEIGPVAGVTRAEIGMEVVKSGRKTRVTHGRVKDVEAVSTKMTYDGLTRQVHAVMTIESRKPWEEVSAGGDSGSLWLDAATHRAVGLHFAGADEPEEYALAMDIRWVLDALKVDLVTGA